MGTREKSDAQPLTIEEQRIRLEERRLDLENSFARKWLPTLATLMVGIIAAMFSYVQQQDSVEETKRTRIQADAKDTREWGFKVVEMYFNNHELFDLTRNTETATLNLRVLAAVAPTAVRGVLDAEQSRIPAPGEFENTNRINSLAAVAGVQDALAAAQRSSGVLETKFKPSDFTVYVQYADGQQNTAVKIQDRLIKLGYRVPGIDNVNKVPSRLEVRYYLPAQKDHAGELAVTLGKALGLPASRENAILLRSSKKLPGGILEVWLPKLSS